MSELVGRILKDLYDFRGSELLQEPQNLELLLEDLCPDELKAIRLVLLGLSHRIPQRLLSHDGTPLATEMQGLCSELQQRHQLNLRFGRWIVETWAAAVGLLPLPLEPRNIFAEAAEEYRNAIKVVLSSGSVTGKLGQELDVLRQQLLLTDDDVNRIQTEVTQDLAQRQQFASHPSLQSLLEPPRSNELGMSFVSIEPGTFLMGSPPYELHREADETLHPVTLTQPYAVQTTPVTQQQWEAVMGSNPSDFKGAALPVENVSWNDVMTRFIPRLNEMGMGSYRLPTEAEWEYAARAGSWQAYYQREDASQLDTYAWYTNNSRFQTHAVGTKASNAWGLYDMHGNIWEWCSDWYNGPYSKEPQTDPSGPQRGLGRVMRGGSWFCNAAACRLATRGYMPPETRIRLIGFRLVRELDHLLET
ncbi:MAG: formylglycine-generating enzyme family protein [Candidatus Sericytochromatia bacterium]